MEMPDSGMTSPSRETGMLDGRTEGTPSRISCERCCWLDFLLDVEDHGPLYHVLQLTHIAGPGISKHHLLRFPGNPLNRLVAFLVEIIDEMPGKKHNVPSPVPQGRKIDRHDLKPVIKVFSESSFIYGFRQLLVRG